MKWESTEWYYYFILSLYSVRVSLWFSWSETESCVLFAVSHYLIYSLYIISRLLLEAVSVKAKFKLKMKRILFWNMIGTQLLSFIVINVIPSQRCIFCFHWRISLLVYVYLIIDSCEGWNSNTKAKPWTIERDPSSSKVQIF